VKHRNTIITLVFFALFFLYFIIRLPYDRRQALLEKELMHEMSFHGRIKEISTNRGVSKVKLDNASEYLYLDNSRNYYLTPYDIGSYLKKGMIIYKNAFSDTLYVMNEGARKKEIFILGDIRLNDSK
jgi:hypothetical protein